MNNFINKIYSLLGIKSHRTKNISKHVFWSFLYKGGSLVATFLLVPLTINYLDTENYGIWLTLSSFIAWFSFFDIGLGNGLRNKFAEAMAKGDVELAKGYVSTAYYSIAVVCFIFFCLSLLIGFFVDWTVIFNTSKNLQKELMILMPILFGCFSLQLMISLITSIYVADQNHSFSGKIGFIISMSSLGVIWLLTQIAESSLLLFGTVFSILPVLIFLFLNIYAFSNRYKAYKPRWSYWKNEHFNDIFGLGINFFVIQVSVVVLFSSDNLIITQLFGPEEVVPYNIAYKYLSISLMIFTMVLTPYWTSITQAYTSGELEWIRNSMNNLFKFSWLAVILIFILVLMAPFTYKLWLGNLVDIPNKLTFSMAIYFTITVFYVPFTFFLNGIGKIKIQMYSTAVGALINIPLSIVLVKYFSLGVEGVIIATIVCVLPNSILFPLQYSKLIDKKANGIWNK